MMEFIKYSVITVVWWWISLTVLSPFFLILCISESFRKMWFSWFFSKCVLPNLTRELKNLRKKTFEQLKKHLGDRKKKTPHEILEIGIGDGANLQFYPENSSLTALDMNENFESYLKDNLKKYPEIRYKGKVIAMAENMVGVEDSSVDVVVCTYVLCSAKNVPSVLKEVKRVLKPGGKFLFLEHVAYPTSDRNSVLQFFVAPLWRTYFCGCILNRNNGEEIKKTGFSNVEYETLYNKHIWLYVRPQIAGIATK